MEVSLIYLHREIHERGGVFLAAEQSASWGAPGEWTLGFGMGHASFEEADDRGVNPNFIAGPGATLATGCSGYVRMVS